MYKLAVERKRVQMTETSTQETSLELTVSTNEISPITVLCALLIMLAEYGRSTR